MNNDIIIDVKDEAPIEIKLENTVYTGDPNLQNKVVTPTTEEQTITYDNEYDGLNEVTVEAIPPNYSKVEFTEDGRFYTDVIELPDNVTSIGEYAFKTTSIKEIVIPTTVTTFGVQAFANAKMDKLTVPTTVKQMGKECFSWAAVTEFTLRCDIDTIPEYCFSGFSMGNGNFVIPETVKTILSNGFAFRQFKSVTEYVLPEGVETIGPMAFRHNTYLQKIHLPASLVDISSSMVFTHNKAMEVVTVGKGFRCSLDIKDSTLYSQETLHNIIDNLADLTGQMAQTLTIGNTNITKISDEYITKLERKNWNYI